MGDGLAIDGAAGVRAAQLDMAKRQTGSATVAESVRSQPAVNPVLVIDSSGVVILQFHEDGDVWMQVPSATAVRAYAGSKLESSGRAVSGTESS